jgi:hypothetical protein
MFVDKSHDFLSLDEMVSWLVEEDITSKMVAREEQLAKLFKRTSKLNAEYHAETSEMVQLLKKAREEQVNDGQILLVVSEWLLVN